MSPSNLINLYVNYLLHFNQYQLYILAIYSVAKKFIEFRDLGDTEIENEVITDTVKINVVVGTPLSYIVMYPMDPSIYIIEQNICIHVFTKMKSQQAGILFQ